MAKTAQIWLRTALVAVLVLAGGAGPGSMVHAARPAVITAVDLTDEQRQDLGWALDLFAAAGLALPPIEAVRHGSTDACFGRRAAHTWRDGRSTIHLCPEEDTAKVRRYRMLHELAHAWDRRALTESRRAAFLRLRGLTEWRNDDPDRWHERGAEHAAEIMVWGLIDRPVRPVSIPDNTCADLLAGYVMLTGRSPLHGFTDRC
jgi:hypothetical protein